MEDMKNQVPSREMFSLSKVTIDKDGGVDVCYEVLETISNENYTSQYQVSSTKEIHPDLHILFMKLRPIMARVFNMMYPLIMVQNPNFMATGAQKELAASFFEECLEAIKVNGVSLSGQEDKAGVILKGLFTLSETQVAKLCTPKLKYNVKCFGFEAELKTIVMGIEREVYAFLFEGKKAQLELFGTDDGEM